MPKTQKRMLLFQSKSWLRSEQANVARIACKYWAAGRAAAAGLVAAPRRGFS